MNNKDYLKDFDLRNFADPKYNLDQIIKDFDKYRYLNEVKKDALKQEPNFIENSINKLFEFINYLVFKKDQFVGVIKTQVNKVVEFKNNQIELLNAFGLRLTKSFEELIFKFVNFRKNYREKAFKASSDSFVLINSAVEKSDYIYSQSVTTLKKVVPSSPQTILRAAAVFGLVTALILPSSNFAAFAEESLPETTTSEVVSEEVPVSEPSPEVSATPELSPEAIEVGSEVIVEPTPTTEASPSVEPEVSPTPDVSPSIEVSPSPSPSVLIINAPTNLNYTPVVEGIKLTWDKTDSEIDKYIVKVDPDGRQIDVAKDTSELLLADLDRKATYSFSVWAVSGELSSDVVSLSVDLAAVKFPRPPMNAEVGGLIVKFEDQPLTSQEVVAIADTTQLTPVSMEVSSELATDTHLVEFAQPVDVATANEIADALEANNNIEYAELDFAFVTASDDSFVPNDPLYASKQWSLWGNFGVGIADGPTGLALAYQNSTGLGSVVAVIDTGFTNHPDLEGQFVSGYDFVSNNEMLSGIREENGNPVPYDGDYIDTNTYGPIGWDENPLDSGDWRNGNNSSWHGTYIAGLIAAKTNNGIGIAGIAPDAKIQPIRAFSWRGGLLSDVIASITWASGGSVENVPANQTPAKVINLSFSVEAPCTPSLQTAIDEAIERGSVVVAAAGNNNSDAANFAPGNCQNVITVGAIDSDGNRANYSNFGSTIDISAPGGEIEGNAIYSTSNEGTTTSTNPAYVVRQGTSIATAQVSAAFAKLGQTYPNENAVQLKTRVLSKEQTKPFPTGNCLIDQNCGIGYLFFEAAAATSITFEPASDAEVNPGPIAIFTRGGSAIYPLTKSGSGPYTYTGTNIDPRTNETFSFTSDSNYGSRGLQEGQIKTSTGFSFTSDSNATYQSVSGVQQLRVNPSSCSNNNTNGYCSIFGPDIYSDNFSATSGQSISYEWGAQGGGDDYESYGFLVKVKRLTITNASLSSNIATVTTSTAHGLQVGDRIEVSNIDATFNGIFTIASIPTSTTLTYSKTASNVTSFSTSGEIVTYGFNSNKTVSNKELTGNVATLTSNNHGFSVGDKVWVFGVDNTFDGTHVLTATTTNTFSYSKIASDVTSASVSDGYVNGSYTLMSYGRGTTKSWTVTSGNIPATGDYRFRFINGTFDASGGFYLGGLMYIKPTVTVGDANEITFPVISDVSDGAVGGTQNISVSATSGQAVTVVSTTTSKCTVSTSHTGTTTTVIITYVASGTCTLTADQTAATAGGSYGPAATVTRSFSLTANKTAQAALTISTTTGTVGQNLTLSTSGGSGTGSISFTLVSTGTASCTLSGSTLTATSAGNCTVNATKASDATYGSATTSNTVITFSAVTTGGGSNPTPTPTPTPTSSVRPTPRPTNLITNPLVVPTPTPSPTPTSTIVPGTQNRPEPLIKRLIEELINPLKPKIVDLFTTPTPRSTNVTGANTQNPVPAPTFDNQKALELAPETQDKKVVELPSLVLVNEVPEPSKVVVVENTIAQIVTPGGGLLNVEAKDGENSIPVDNRGRVQMVRKNNVETEGKGMAPNSEFAVYLFSDPILLGIGKTNAKGEFFASFPVEDQLPIGDHTLQVNGLLPDGKTASISMPVTVVDSIETAKNQAMPKTIFVSENPIDKALKALYWMLIVLAVMMFLIAAANRKRFFALFRRRDDEEETQTI